MANTNERLLRVARKLIDEVSRNPEMEKQIEQYIEQEFSNYCSALLLYSIRNNSAKLMETYDAEFVYKLIEAYYTVKNISAEDFFTTYLNMPIPKEISSMDDLEQFCYNELGIKSYSESNEIAKALINKNNLIGVKFNDVIRVFCR